MAPYNLLLVCFVSAYISAGDIDQPHVSQQSVPTSNWYSYWTQAQQKAAPYVANFQNFWQASAQPRLKQWSERATHSLTGLGSATNLVEAVRQDDPELILAIHKMCKRPQLAYLWQYNPPVLLTTWLLRKAYLKGMQALENLSSIEDRITLLKEKRESLNKQIDEILAQVDAYKRIHALQNNDDLFTFNITQVADILQKQIDNINSQINKLTEQAPLDEPSWLDSARNYLSAHWPTWLQR